MGIGLEGSIFLPDCGLGEGPRRESMSMPERGTMSARLRRRDCVLGGTEEEVSVKCRESVVRGKARWEDTFLDVGGFD